MEKWHAYPSIPHYEEDRFREDEKRWIATEKIHGANISILWDGEQIQVFSRRRALTNDNKFHGFQSLTQDIALREEGVIIYGEIYGRGVQKELLYNPDVRIVYFDVFRDDSFLPFEEAKDYCESLGLTFIDPIIRLSGYQVSDWIECVAKQMKTKYSSIDSNQVCEGVVLRNEKTKEKYKYVTDSYTELKKGGNRSQVKTKLVVERFISSKRLYVSARSKFDEEVSAEQLFDEIYKDITQDTQVLERWTEADNERLDKWVKRLHSKEHSKE